MDYDEYVSYVYSSRLKRIRIVIYPDERIVVSLPMKTAEYDIRCFMEKSHAWIEKTIQKIKKRNKNGYEKITVNYNDMKQSTLELINSRIFIINRIYNVSWKNISVRNQKTRWGSCSTSGNLQFHVAMGGLPLHLVDYIIAHELSHIIEMNHSDKFWAHVARAIPDYKSCVKELKKYHIEVV